MVYTSWFTAVGAAAPRRFSRSTRTLAPGATIEDAVREGYRINLPPRERTVAAEVTPLLTVDDDAVVPP